MDLQDKDSFLSDFMRGFIEGHPELEEMEPEEQDKRLESATGWANGYWLAVSSVKELIKFSRINK